MSRAYKCDLCGRYDNNAYAIPHPHKRSEFEICPTCYEQWQRVYKNWLKEMGWKDKKIF